MRRCWRLAVALAVAVFAAGLVAYGLADGAGAEPFVDHDPASLALRLAKTLDGWLWIVAIMGAAGTAVQRRVRAEEQVEPRSTGRGRQRLARHANEAVLPFYVLHETVIVAVAFVVLRWPIGGAAQYVLIVILSLTGTLAVYDIGVRRTRVTRWLLGLRPHAASRRRAGTRQDGRSFRLDSGS